MSHVAHLLHSNERTGKGSFLRALLERDFGTLGSTSFFVEAYLATSRSNWFLGKCPANAELHLRIIRGVSGLLRHLVFSIKSRWARNQSLNEVRDVEKLQGYPAGISIWRIQSKNKGLKCRADPIYDTLRGLEKHVQKESSGPDQKTKGGGGQQYARSLVLLPLCGCRGRARLPLK